jgi:hypothetical protein
MQLLADEADDRIGASLFLFEDNILKTYAEWTYDNYVRFLDPYRDLPQILDPQELTYIDNNGQVRQVRFGENLRDVTFVFENAKRMMDRDAKLGKYNRFLQLLGLLAQLQPALQQYGVDGYFLIKDTAKQLDIGDIDYIMPPNMTPMAQFQKLQQQMAQMNLMLNAQNGVLNQAVKGLQEIGDASGLQVLNNAYKQGQEYMQSQLQGAPQ